MPKGKSRATKSGIHATARNLARELGLEFVHVQIGPNRLVDEEGNTIIPTFILGETKHDMLTALKGAMYAVQYHKEFKRS